MRATAFAVFTYTLCEAWGVPGEVCHGMTKLLVFLHVSLKQRAFQGLLQSALSGVDVTAVGRIADFERGLADAPDAVLTLPVVLLAKNMRVALQGLHAGASEEKYALVGADSAPDPSRVKTVGALDLLGRDGTNAFVSRMLDNATKVERVAKVEDLLPLLQMQRVDAILLPQRLFSDVKSASRINLVARELGKPVGLPALAALGPGAAAVSSSVSKLPMSLSETMGVDGWH